MLIKVIILIVCICILLVILDNNRKNKHFFSKKKYTSKVLPIDIIYSSRPIIKDKLVWIPPPIKYNHITKHKGHIKHNNKIRNNINNFNDKNFFKNRVKILDNKYIGNNIIENKKIEHFDSYGYGSIIQHPKKNCPKLNMTQCLKFQNCGYITTYDFNNRCVPGDPHGPLDKKIKYQKYYHNDPFTRALIANDNNYRDMSKDVFDIE